MALGNAAQPVELGADLLVVVKNPGHVMGEGLTRERGGQPQQHGHSRLHVGGPAAVEPASREPGGQVVRDRHGVEVPGQQHPGRQPQVGTGNDGVAVPVDPQSGDAGQSRFDQVREDGLGAAHRRDVDQGAGQLHRRGGQVERRAAAERGTLGGWSR